MRLLMCPPLYYGIENEVNPWKSRSRQSEPELAKEQWRGLYRLVHDQLDVEVVLVEPRVGLPDMAFAANCGLVWQNKFIASNFRHEARQGEILHFENWFQVRGYEIYHLPGENLFEGEGNLLMCGDLFFSGYHIRSDTLSHQKIAEILHFEVLSLELSNVWPYHLDTCFCPLKNNRAIFYPGAFNSDALKILEDRISTLIPVQEDEARRFACNSIVVGTNVVMIDGCPAVRSSLEKLGYSVFETPLSEYVKAGGSAKCLVLKVPHHEGPKP